VTHQHRDLLNPPILLPPDPGAAALAALAPHQDASAVAVAHPESSAVWAALALAALDHAAPRSQRVVEGYAYARTGYHRGLDALRRHGWRGTGAVPWSHEDNRGVLRAIWALGAAAAAIGETAEVERLTALLDDCDPAARPALAAETT
jgi:hypothetical protein